LCFLVAGSGEIESSNSSQDPRPLLGGSSLKSRGSSGAQKRWSNVLRVCCVSFVMFFLLSSGVVWWSHTSGQWAQEVTGLMVGAWCIYWCDLEFEGYAKLKFVAVWC
jgi:hypothetical protein